MDGHRICHGDALPEAVLEFRRSGSIDPVRQRLSQLFQLLRGIDRFELRDVGKLVVRRQPCDRPDALPLGKAVERREKVGGCGDTDPSLDQPGQQLAFPFDPTPLDTFRDSQFDALQPTPLEAFRATPFDSLLEPLPSLLFTPLPHSIDQRHRRSPPQQDS
jgi:hypothetical protein